tara:strand:+ start:225 stop:683 length:459 start_codon:yes stop_codon:yes gene_type:complete
VTTKKEFNGGTWTTARMRSFVMSALRKARWPGKYAAIKTAYVKTGINPATGRMCKLHKCQQCGNLFPQASMAVDHIDPVVPIDGFSKANGFLGYDWDQVIRRLFCEVEGLQVLCKPCHKLKSADERAERAAAKNILINGKTHNNNNNKTKTL